MPPRFNPRHLPRLPFTRAKRQLVAKLLGRANIHIGSIVRCRDDNKDYVLVMHETKCLTLRRLADGAHKTVNTPSPSSLTPQLDVDLVGNPPEGWVHPLAVQPYDCDDSTDFAQACKDLRGFINERLAMGDRRVSPYGVLWSVPAVERLTAAFNGERECEAVSWH